MVAPKGHWATKVKVDFTADFDEKGIPYEKTQEEREMEDMQELQKFFRMTGDALKPLHLLALALQSARERDMPKGTIESMPAVKFAYRWRANVRLRTLSKSARNSLRGSEEQPATEAPDGAAAPAAASSSTAPPVPEQRRGQSPGSPRAGKASPKLPPRLSIASTRKSTASARDPQRSPLGTPRARARQSAASSRGGPRSPSGTPRGTPRAWGASASPRSDYKYSLGASLYSLWEGSMDSEDAITHQELLKQARGPITPTELQAARPPVPLIASDLPPIFKRPSGRTCDQPQETHYEYFRRRLPEQNAWLPTGVCPDQKARRQDYKQRQVNSARRTLNYRVDRINTGAAGGETFTSFARGSAPHSARARMARTR